MPCDSSHLAPRTEEVESVKVLICLGEIGCATGEYSPVYGRVATLDRDTAILCEWCKIHDVTKYSLELQIWWRDHQRADAAKERRRKEDAYNHQMRIRGQWFTEHIDKGHSIKRRDTFDECSCGATFHRE